MHMTVSLLKWIFSLHQLAWFISGSIATFVMTYTYMKMKQKGVFSKGSYTFVVLASLLTAFTILWSYDSYIENEVRAANMGILVFGGLTVVCALAAYKLKVKHESAAEATIATAKSASS